MASAMLSIRTLVITALLGSVLLLSSFFASELKTKPDISWQQKKLERVIFQGGRVSEDIGFISHKDFESLRIWISPEIEKYVFATPLIIERVQAGSVVRLQIIFVIPPDLNPGTYDGTLHIRKDNRTIASPLPISFTVELKPEPSPTPTPSPELMELFYDDGTAEGFDFDPVLGRAVFFSKFVLQGTQVKILGARIFLKIVKEPPTPIDVYVWDFNRQPLISPVRVTPLESGWFFVDLSPYNLVVSDEFYIGMAWVSSDAPPLLGIDLSSTPQGKSYVVILSTNTFIPVVNANIMIRAIVEKL
ncbi:MAG: hypothetical protein ACK4NX_01970 [Candidatus Paceibacteria bacterium]